MSNVMTFKNCISYLFVLLIFEFQLSGIVDVCLYVLGKKEWENAANKEMK